MVYRLGPKLRHVHTTEVDGLLRTCGYATRPYVTKEDRTDYYVRGDHTFVSAWVKGDRARYHLHNANNFPLNLDDYQFDRREDYCSKEEINAIFTTLKKIADAADVPPRCVAPALRIYTSPGIHLENADFRLLLKIIAQSTLSEDLLLGLLRRNYTLSEIQMYNTMNPGLVADLLM